MDESGFRQCIMPLHKTLFAYAFSILHDENDAADCVQEALTKLWLGRDRLENIGNVAAYASRTVRNLALNMASRSPSCVSPFGDSPPEIPDSSLSPAANTRRMETMGEISSLLALLPDSQRRVVVLSSVSGLSNSEIQQATGFSEENVRVLLSRGRKKLRELFSKLNNNPHSS